MVFQLSDVEAVATERLEEGGLRLRSYPRLKEIPDLAQYRGWHQQRSLGVAQQLYARPVRLIFDVARSQEDSGIAQQHVSCRVRR